MISRMSTFFGGSSPAQSLKNPGSSPPSNLSNTFGNGCWGSAGAAGAAGATGAAGAASVGAGTSAAGASAIFK